MTARRQALGERIAARLLETMGELALTQSEMAAHVKVSTGPISSAVRILRSRGQIYISDYRLTDKSATAVYRLGNLPDAEKPARNSAFLAQTSAKVLEMLDTGDKSTKEIMMALGMTKERVHSIMAHLRETKQAHVTAMSGGRNTTHIYRAGPGKDYQRAMRPEISRKTIRELPPIDPMMAALFGRAA